MPKMPLPHYDGRLIVHTGDHKTGTTTIQESLARGDVTLSEGRLAYPLGKTQFNHNGLLRRHKAGPFSFAHSVPVDDAFAKFARRSRKIGADVTVLSAEQLESVRPDALESVLKHHGLPFEAERLMVITYLRPHIPRVISGLAERIKIGWVPANPWRNVEARARMRLRYNARLTAWGKVFGPAHIVRPALRAELVGGDALEDFLATALGPKAAHIAPPNPHAKARNESLGIEDLMRLHVIHQSLPGLGRTDHHLLGWYLAQEIDTLRAPGGPVTRLRAHKSLALRLRRAFRADARKVDEGWFDGRPLFATALDEAVSTALPKRQPLHPGAWLDAGEISALRARAPEFRALLTSPGQRAKLQAQRLAHLAPQTPPPAPAPARA